MTRWGLDNQISDGDKTEMKLDMYKGFGSWFYTMKEKCVIQYGKWKNANLNLLGLPAFSFQIFYSLLPGFFTYSGKHLTDLLFETFLNHKVTLFSTMISIVWSSDRCLRHGYPDALVLHSYFKMSLYEWTVILSITIDIHCECSMNCVWYMSCIIFSVIAHESVCL